MYGKGGRRRVTVQVAGAGAVVCAFAMAGVAAGVAVPAASAAGAPAAAAAEARASVGVSRLESGRYSASAKRTARPASKSAKKTAKKRVSTPPRHRTGRVAYLTFDDGPNPRYTPEVLRLLKKHDAKATFFMIGSSAKANPSLVRKVRAGGHALGNHTYSHPWLTKVGAAQVRWQLRAADKVLGRTTCMRPPGGFVNASVRSVAAREGKHVVMWNVDTWDWARPGVAKIVNTVATKTRPGSVILMHDGGGNRGQTTAALAKILPRLSAQGYRFETLPKCR